MPVEQLTELQYSTDRKGPWKLYIYESDGYHRGGQWFRNPPLKYHDEEITSNEAHSRTSAAITAKREVRICDGGDMLVFHSENGRVIYPAKPREFWREILPH